MPKTKFQEVVFTIIMVIVMVYAMVVYNIAMDMGSLSNKVFVMAFGELPIMVVIAFVIEMFLVGPLAKKQAFRIVTPGADKPILVVLTISALTVCLMCPLMSFIATLLFNGVNTQLVSNWLQKTVINFPMALCWQIFFAGPFVRLVFGKAFSKSLQ